MLDFRELRYVVEIVERGGFSKAAKQLYISQPSLSQYVKKLEESLGCALFRRKGNTIRLTSAGEAYYTFAKETLEKKEKFVRAMDEISSLEKGHLRIGVAFFRSMFFIPKLLPPFHRRYPGVTVELFERAAPLLERAVAQCELDLALSNLPVYVGGLAQERLMDERLLLAIPPGHRLCNHLVYEKEEKGGKGGGIPQIDLKLAAREKFIMMPQQYRLRFFSNHACLDAGFTPDILLETANFGTAQYLVANGLGLTFTPETLAMEESIPLRPVYATFQGKTFTWPIAIIYNAKAYISDAARAFMETARSVLGPQAG